MAAAYAYGSSDAFYGTNATGQELAMDIYNYCVKKPEIPDVSMSFSDANVKAYVEGNHTAYKGNHIPCGRTAECDDQPSIRRAFSQREYRKRKYTGSKR